MANAASKMPDMGAWVGVDSGRAAPSAPGAPSASPPNPIASAIQQHLIKNQLPVRRTDPQFPDGSWGPISNTSLGRLIERYSGDEKMDQVAQKLKLVYNPISPTATNLSAVAQLLNIAVQQPQIGGKRPQQQPQAQMFFPVMFNGTEYRVELTMESLASADEFESMLQGIGMMPMNLPTQNRAQYIDAIIRAIYQTIPEEGRSALKRKLLELRKELVNKYAQEGLKKPAKEEFAEIYASILQGNPPDIIDRALTQVIAELKAQGIVTADGYIDTQSKTRFSQGIRQSIEEALYSFGGAPAGRQGGRRQT